MPRHGISIHFGLQVDPRVAAIDGVSWDSPYREAGLQGGRYTVPMGKEQIQIEQVNVKSKFTPEDAQNIINAIF